MNPDLTYLYNIVKSASKELIKINTLITHKPKNKTNQSGSELGSEPGSKPGSGTPNEAFHRIEDDRE